jgi:glycyl-tRNA synthetase (class II)
LKKEKNNYKDIFVECPRCNNYFSLDQLAEVLERKGVQENTIEQIFSDIVFSEAHVF